MSHFCHAFLLPLAVFGCLLYFSNATLGRLVYYALLTFQVIFQDPRGMFPFGRVLWSMVDPLILDMHGHGLGYLCIPSM